MKRVLVIGAGAAGCSLALRLAECGARAVLVERQGAIGGRVRQYGCKATDVCNNCGVCLTAGLWDKVAHHENIEVLTDARLTALSGEGGSYAAAVETPGGMRYYSGLSDVVAATGFESLSTGISSHLEVAGEEGILTGTQIEAALLSRDASSALPEAPQSVAFIQCFGSRDEKERALYCSRVCCSYSTRAAKVLKYYYPDIQITFFYMELQPVAARDYYKELTDLGVEFIKCRPLDITGGKPVQIRYDDPAKGLTTRSFDKVVLSDGIHPASGVQQVSGLLGLEQDDDGFLREVRGQRGVFVAGCAARPRKIDESIADAKAVANRILAEGFESGGLCV